MQSLSEVTCYFLVFFQAFVASELAEIIMENWRTNNSSAENEFMAPDNQPSSETDLYKHIQLYREMLLAGATKV